MRLIDADAFDKMLTEAQSECKRNGGNFRFGVLGNVRANLAVFPTVDRPEIVRCKDCRFRDDPNSVISEWLPCHFGETPDNWYCASGRTVPKNRTIKKSGVKRS